jgi:hypothetical protein
MARREARSAVTRSTSPARDARPVRVRWRGRRSSRSGRPVFETLSLDQDALVAYYASMGWLADLADSERLPLLDGVRDLLTEQAYRSLWETRIFWTRRAAS